MSQRRDRKHGELDGKLRRSPQTAEPALSDFTLVTGCPVSPSE